MKHSQLLLNLLGFLDLYSVGMLTPGFFAHIKSLHGTPLIIGALGSIYGFLQTISSPMIGRLADLYGRRFILIRCLGATSFSYFLLCFGNLGILFLSRIIGGIGKHSQMVCRVYLADTVSVGEKASAFGMFNSISNLGFIIGPIVGGYLQSSFENGFIITALIASFLFFMQFFLVAFCLHEADPNISDVLILETPYNFFASWQSWEFYEIQIFMRFFLTLANSTFRLSMLFLLQEVYSVSPFVIGLIISYQGIIATVTSSFAGYIHKLHTNVFVELFYTSVLFSVSICCIWLISSVKWLCLVLIPLSASAAIIRVASLHAITSLVPLEKLGCAVGLGATVSACARAVSPFVTAFAFEFNPQYPTAISALSSVLGTFIAWHFKSRKICLSNHSNKQFHQS